MLKFELTFVFNYGFNLIPLFPLGVCGYSNDLINRCTGGLLVGSGFDSYSEFFSVHMLSILIILLTFQRRILVVQSNGEWVKMYLP